MGAGSAAVACQPINKLAVGRLVQARMLNAGPAAVAWQPINKLAVEVAGSSNDAECVEC